MPATEDNGLIPFNYCFYKKLKYDNGEMIDDKIYLNLTESNWFHLLFANS